MNNMNSSEVGLSLILTTDGDSQVKNITWWKNYNPVSQRDWLWSFEWVTVARKCLWTLWNHIFCINYWL